MKPNIGTVNALVRITAGFTMLAWVISKMVWKPYRESNLWIAMAAGMKIAEGITRFCPLTYMFEKYQVDIKEKETENEDLQEDIVNPS